MDPQSVAFTPRTDPWGLQTEMSRVSQIQQEHGERLLRLEKRQEDEARMKSVWGTSSPFPGILSGTPQHGPIHRPPVDAFNSFDEDQQTNLIGSLHLDTDEEPRRLGLTSRANSVRFDETANPGHWAHASRSSLDFLPRTPSALSGLGHPMIERSSSHKSDGRHSSGGHSALSTSVRVNSLGIDTMYRTGLSPSSPTECPGLAPGLLILGAAPAIIRCWLNTNFKHDTLLYAAVCTGSYKSFLDFRLVDRLGFTQLITRNDEGARVINLPVYLPEAIMQRAACRSNSPAPQLPLLTVKFTVIDRADDPAPKAIQIFLGSDMLRAHNADISFSSNTLTMFDDERSKLSVPLVRPEDEATFRSLYVTSGQSGSLTAVANAQDSKEAEVGQTASVLVNGTNGSQGQRSPSVQSASEGSQEAKAASSASLDPAAETRLPDTTTQDDAPRRAMSSVDLSNHIQKPSLTSLNTKSDVKDTESTPSTATPSRTGSSPAIWSSWRRDPSQNQSNQTDSPSMGKGGSSGTYQRPGRDQGIKVLKPVRQPLRLTGQSGPGSPSPSSAQSRFFDDGRRKSSPFNSDTVDWQLKKSASEEKPMSATNGKENPAAMASKSRSANPIGSASAFAWMNTGQSK